MKKEIGMEVYSRISDMSPPRKVHTSGRAWQARKFSQPASSCHVTCTRLQSFYFLWIVNVGS